MPVIEVAQPPVVKIDRDVFLVRFAPDCMAHECRCNGSVELDACCRYGADVDLFEKERILARTELVASVVHEKDPARWFADDEAVADPEAPSGVLTRTARRGPGESDGCIFLGHDGRGCGLHRAALAGGIDPSSFKPRVCQLFPLGLEQGVLGISSDFSDYSCAGLAGAPTIYQVMRPTLTALFGEGLVRRLDTIERQIGRLRV